MDSIHAYKSRVDAWNRYARNWKAINWIVGTVGIGTSSLAASSVLKGDLVHIVPAIAAVCMGFLGFASPLMQAKKYDTAANLLEVAIDKYTNNLVDIEYVINAFEKALSLPIGDGDYKRQDTGKTTPPNPAPQQPGGIVGQ